MSLSMPHLAHLVIPFSEEIKLAGLLATSFHGFCSVRPIPALFGSFRIVF